MAQDLLCHFLRFAEEPRALRRELRIELSPRHRCPAALLADVRHHAGEAGVEILGGLLRRVGHVAERVHPDLQLVRRETRPSTRFAVKIDEGTEAVCLAADDRDHQREPEQASANERLWGPADADPDREALLQRPRIHALSAERSSELAGPLGVFLIAEPQQELQLLREELVVVAEVETEEREGVDERAPPDDHLGSTL